MNKNELMKEKNPEKVFFRTQILVYKMGKIEE